MNVRKEITQATYLKYCYIRYVKINTVIWCAVNGMCFNGNSYNV